MLWTWQGDDFDPVVDRLDRSKSHYWVREACPNLRQSYAELDELLCLRGLPKDREHQFVWCYTTAPRTDWYGCRLWPLDVPQDSILAYLDSRIWEHLIGGALPADLQETWRHELHSRRITAEQWQQEFSRKEREYHDSFGSRGDCLAVLLSPTGPGEDVLALVALPLDPSWIRSSCELDQGIVTARQERARTAALLAARSMLPLGTRATRPT